MLLNNWKMNYREHSGLECTAPCSMYSVLLEHKLIPDPFYGMNDRELRDYSLYGCSFTTEFDVSEEEFNKEYNFLKFNGLDTICTITLNGEIIGKTKNMHRRYEFDVKSLLKKNGNVLTLEFDSPLEYFREMDNKHYIFADADNEPGAPQLRKCLSMSGWNWCPSLPDMGIFRSVELDSYDIDKIDDFFVRQYHKDGVVTLEITASSKHNSDSVIFAEIDGKRVELKNGKASVVIDNPKLWWVRGYGEQNLYDISIELVNVGKAIDKVSKKIGLRTLTISNTFEGDGSEFAFVINGVKIFAMGANYVPEDNIFPRINIDVIDKLLHQCMDANYNCIRIWGGGYYPSEEFYDLCDKYGLMVWQDFMFGCNNVYLHKEFKEEIIQEAIDNVKRIRNHASLALLCGNNENEHLIWDNPNRIDIGQGLLIKNDYLELFEHILPDICDELAPHVFYWPSTPSSFGGFNDPDNLAYGDTHFWQVFCWLKPYEIYRDYKLRFCSEFGFSSFPNIKTIHSFGEDKDMNVTSRVMENHQKWSEGNKVISTFILENYLQPVNMEQVALASQLLQADALSYAVEHYRRLRGYCMGALYWQVNDCCPVISWSSIDYFGRYKALHYVAKKFFAPVELGLFTENGKLIANIANETMDSFCGKVKIFRANSNLTVLDSCEADFTVDKLTSEDVLSVKINDERPYDTYYYAELYDNAGNLITRHTHLLCKPKHFEWQKPEIKLSTEKVPGGVQINISADTFVKGLEINFRDFDANPSDNYFDIVSGDTYKITVETDLSCAEVLDNISCISTYDIGK